MPGAADLVHNAQSDPDPSVQAWATYLFTVMTGDKKSWNELIDDPLWLKRLLSVIAADTMDLPRDRLKPLAENDPDEVVRRLAGAALQVKLARPAATQPTTVPVAGAEASQPSIGQVPAPAQPAPTPESPAPAPTGPATVSTTPAPKPSPANSAIPIPPPPSPQ